MNANEPAVRVRRDIHGLGALQLAIASESLIDHSSSSRRRPGAHLRQKGVILLLMTVEVRRRIVGAMKKAEKDKRKPSRK